MSEERLKDLYRRIYARPTLIKTLKIIGAVSVALVAVLFSFIVIRCIYFGSYLFAVKLVLMAGIPFCAVSIMRVLVDVKRPYEVIDSPELTAACEGRKLGKSFPSRHVFSVFVLGVLAFSCSVPIAIAVLLLGVFVALERVLLGVHFIRDVVVGSLLGVVSGLIGLVIL